MKDYEPDIPVYSWNKAVNLGFLLPIFRLMEVTDKLLFNSITRPNLPKHPTLIVLSRLG